MTTQTLDLLLFRIYSRGSVMLIAIGCKFSCKTEMRLKYNMIKLLLTLLSENSRSVCFEIGHEKVSFDWLFSQLAWNTKSFSSR